MRGATCLLVNKRVRQGRALSQHISTHVSTGYWPGFRFSHCGSSVGFTRCSARVCVSDAVNLAESLEVLVMGLQALHGWRGTLDFRHRSQDRGAGSGGVPDETVQSAQACGEKNFISLPIVVQSIVSLPRKSHGGLARPAVLWSPPARVYGVVDAWAEEQSYGSSSCFCSLVFTH